MKWSRQDAMLVAVVWLTVVGVVLLVCVLLPTPPPASDPRFVSVLLDFFFGAVMVALVSGIAAVFCAFRFVQRLSDELAERDQQSKRALRDRGERAR
jgi:drug/metabolite transporter (DMT)-like permease